MLNPLTMPLPHLPQQRLLSGSDFASSSAASPNGLFSQMLRNAMENVAQQQSRAETLIEDHLLGKPVTEIEVLTAIKQSELTLKTMLQVRNKVVEAYQELKQIQV